MHSLADRDVELGHIRATFFMSQAQSVSKISAASHGDFLVDGKYLVEVGAKASSNINLLEQPIDLS